jgi:hypothetical protein
MTLGGDLQWYHTPSQMPANFIAEAQDVHERIKRLAVRDSSYGGPRAIANHWYGILSLFVNVTDLDIQLETLEALAGHMMYRGDSIFPQVHTLRLPRLWERKKYPRPGESYDPFSTQHLLQLFPRVSVLHFTISWNNDNSICARLSTVKESFGDRLRRIHISEAYKPWFDHQDTSPTLFEQALIHLHILYPETIVLERVMAGVMNLPRSMQTVHVTSWADGLRDLLTLYAETANATQLPDTLYLSHQAPIHFDSSSWPAISQDLVDRAIAGWEGRTGATLSLAVRQSWYACVNRNELGECITQPSKNV